MGQRREQWSSVEKQEALLFHGCRRRWLPTVSGEDVVRVEEEREEKGRESEQKRRKTKKSFSFMVTLKRSTCVYGRVCVRVCACVCGQVEGACGVCIVV